MKKLLFSGLIVTVPLALTFYAFYIFYNYLTSLSQWTSLPQFPGSGILYLLILILIVGVISKWWVAREGIALIEKLITKFPGFKMLYYMSKEAVSSFAGEKRAFNKAVLFQEQERVMRIGFITTENVQLFELGEDYISVYFPHGLQISGEIRLVARDKVIFLQTPVEDALQFCLSAGVAARKQEIHRQE
jgi:uncharacterized membrane protein